MNDEDGTNERKHLILEYKAEGRSTREISDLLGIPYNTLRGFMSRHNISRTPLYSQFKDILIPDNLKDNPDKALIVPDDNCLLIGDLHCPYHHKLMLRRAIFVVRTYFPAVRTCIIGGDTFDFSSLSSHPHNSKEADLDETLERAADTLRFIGSYFKHLYILNGNHDERFSKKLDKSFTLKHLFSAAFGQHWPTSETMITNYDYVRVKDTWIVGHPSNYSGQGGKTPADYADIYRLNVACFHNHLIGESQSKSGLNVGIDVGHMTDPEQHYYRERRMSKYTRWNSGFVVLSNGYATRFTETFTDWTKWGCVE